MIYIILRTYLRHNYVANRIIAPDITFPIEEWSCMEQRIYQDFISEKNRKQLLVTFCPVANITSAS